MRAEQRCSEPHVLGRGHSRRRAAPAAPHLSPGAADGQPVPEEQAPLAGGKARMPRRVWQHQHGEVLGRQQRRASAPRHHPWLARVQSLLRQPAHLRRHGPFQQQRRAVLGAEHLRAVHRAPRLQGRGGRGGRHRARQQLLHLCLGRQLGLPRLLGRLRRRAAGAEQPAGAAGTGRDGLLRLRARRHRNGALLGWQRQRSLAHGPLEPGDRSGGPPRGLQLLLRRACYGALRLLRQIRCAG